MVAGQAAKAGVKMLAGQQLGKYFDVLSGAVGKVATQGTQALLQKGTDTFAKGVAQKNLPAILRSSATSTLPKAVGAAAQLGTAGLALYGIDRTFDQQSQHSQPMSGGTGDRGMDNFIMSQQLQNQKFMHDMALVQARAESRTPGAQYGGSLQEQQAFSRGVLDEVGGIGRYLLGTGLRA